MEASRAETVVAVREILARVLHLSLHEVAPDMPIRSLRNADSAAVLEATIGIEDRFAVEFPEEVVFRLETVADVVAAVERLRCDAVRSVAAENGNDQDGRQGHVR
jgi:acyl carrier protein